MPEAARKRGRPFGSKKKRGQEPMISQEIIAQISRDLRRGSYADTAAASLGISRVSLAKWLRRGARARRKGSEDPEDTLYMDLVVAVDEAYAIAETIDLKRVNVHIKNGDAGMLRWKMSHRYKDHWAKKTEKVVTHQGKISHEHKHAHITLNDLDLPLEVKKLLLDKVREKKAILENSQTVLENKPSLESKAP